MSFWDKVGKAVVKTAEVGAKAAVAAKQEVEKKSAEMVETQAKLEGYSDDRLFKILASDGFFSNSSMEKTVANKLLRQRGFDQEEIKQNIQRYT
ncbi:TPA: hypothetical protein NGS68_003184 [Vibrio parahaemolyticus]|uniref:hypothetical protein n=1 Tax=Vibrio parahaemolyticus TaxID=670 RepID=UPI002B20BB72|nr:hypothetical protein [Vibrio parahaemolyticus]EGQ8536577.1 hypothetical protein [Vibrio parahaemolyticus]EIV8645912.1 hypothetical protein [Vibrio parahaemolyticus]MEA5316071.1 hypothetical protein [Vibrio parahaemolyticus]HCE1979874.1 hypothetical protein [Vibrio parahaemolyticus]HCG6658670.1 hypothetical protein [Vibrio parahaemolyticus]